MTPYTLCCCLNDDWHGNISTTQGFITQNSIHSPNIHSTQQSKSHITVFPQYTVSLRSLFISSSNSRRRVYSAVIPATGTKYLNRPWFDHPDDTGTLFCLATPITLHSGVFLETACSAAFAAPPISREPGTTIFYKVFVQHVQRGCREYFTSALEHVSHLRKHVVSCMSNFCWVFLG
jgi:hypothetical protein